MPKLLGRDFDKLGKYWLKGLEIDIVGVCGNEVIFGECKWKDNINAKKVLSKLEKKVKKINIRAKILSMFYLQRVLRIKLMNLEGIWVYCFDLKDIESKI